MIVCFPRVLSLWRCLTTFRGVWHISTPCTMDKVHALDCFLVASDDPVVNIGQLIVRFLNVSHVGMFRCWHPPSCTNPPLFFHSPCARRRAQVQTGDIGKAVVMVCLHKWSQSRRKQVLKSSHNTDLCTSLCHRMAMLMIQPLTPIFATT